MFFRPLNLQWRISRLSSATPEQYCANDMPSSFLYAFIHILDYVLNSSFVGVRILYDLGHRFWMNQKALYIFLNWYAGHNNLFFFLYFCRYFALNLKKMQIILINTMKCCGPACWMVLFQPNNCSYDNVTVTFIPTWVTSTPHPTFNLNVMQDQ